MFQIFLYYFPYMSKIYHKIQLPYTIPIFITISFNTPLKMRLLAYNIYYVYFKYTHNVR